MRQSNHLSFSFDVFVSYAHRDKHVVKPIVNELRTHSIKPWLDEEQIGLGDCYPEKIENGLKSSRYILICLSKNYKNSDWCKTEFQSIFARINGNSEQNIIPVIIDDCDKDDIPLFLCDKLYVDIRERSGVDQLIRTIKPLNKTKTNTLVNVQKEFLSIFSKSTSDDDTIIAYDNFGTKILSVLSEKNVDFDAASELILSYRTEIESLINSGIHEGYRHHFKKKLKCIDDAFICTFRHANDSNKYLAASFSLNFNDSPYTYDLNCSLINEVVEKILSADEIERDTGLDWLLKGDKDSLTKKLDSIQDKSDRNRVLIAIWKISPRVLLYYNDKLDTFLQYLVAADSTKWGFRVELLRNIFSGIPGKDKILSMVNRIPEKERVVFWGFLILNKDSSLRNLAVKQIGREERWTYFLSNIVPTTTIMDLYEASTSDCPDIYLKAAFLTIKERIMSASTPLSLKNSYDFMKIFYKHKLFLQETFFKELTIMHNTLSKSAKLANVSEVFDKEMNDFFKSFISNGMVRDVMHGELSHMPLTVQKLLSRKGYFIEIFSCHSRDIIALETVCHIERKENAHTIIRQMRINAKVLEQVATNKIFMNKYINRVTFCNHPKAQPEQVRSYISGLHRQDIKSLSLNKNASFFARDLATKYATRYA